MRLSPALLILPLLAGCAAVPQTGQPSTTVPPRTPEETQVPPTQPPPPSTAGFRAPQILQVPGLEGIIRQDANSLIRMFGTPRLDVTEGDMRKLQFAGTPCVFDIFLYPLQRDGQPVATYVEARRASDGREVDRVACANALRR